MNQINLTNQNSDLQNNSGFMDKLLNWLRKYKILINIITCISLFVVIIWLTIFIFAQTAQEYIANNFNSSKISLSSKDSAQINQNRKLAQKDIEKINKRLSTLIPTAPYLIINTSDNTFVLYNKKSIVRTGKCSTGSYILLKSQNNKEWMFKTPKGEKHIHGKQTSPVWTKPDWAFIEEGMPVPPKGHESRIEAGVLGDYALSLGDGYLIHGTLYQRFLGLPVTHGCVRMGDADLEVVFKTLQIGNKVYIY